MPCFVCGADGHNVATCPVAAAVSGDAGDPSKRGHRVSPRTPGNEVSAKLAKLEGIQNKLSPVRDVPALPHASGAAASGDGQRTSESQTSDQKLDKIMEMMKNVVVKSDLEGLKDEMLKEADRKTKVAISEAIDPLKNEMSDVKADVANIKSQISHAEKKNSDENNMLANKIKGIEAAIAHLKISPAQGGNDQATAVIGGLESASSSEAAVSWVKEVIAKRKIEGVISVYDKCKGRAFNGMIFVKFGCVEKRDAAMKVFNDAKSTFAETRNFMSRDLPFQQRVKFSFLRNFKRLLTCQEWGFQNVNFDDDAGTISVAGQPVLEVAIDDSTFKTSWTNYEWGQWKDLTDDPKFKALLTAAENKLSKAAQFGTKGKGKANTA